MLVVLPSVVLVWVLLIPMGGSLGASFIDLLKDLAILVIGLAVTLIAVQPTPGESGFLGMALSLVLVPAIFAAPTLSLIVLRDRLLLFLTSLTVLVACCLAICGGGSLIAVPYGVVCIALSAKGLRKTVAQR